MLRAFKVLGVVALAFALVWALVIVRWQETHRVVRTEDVALYLVALPVGLLLAFWLLWRGIERLRRPPAAPAVAAPDAQAAADAQAQANAAQERALSVRVLGQQVCLPVGADAVSALAALADPAARPPLDAQIKDADGFPIAVARIADLRLDEAQGEELAALAPGRAWSDEALRALAALDAVLMPALDTYATARPLPPAPDHAPVPAPGALPVPAARRAAPPPAPGVRVALFVDARFDETQRQALGRWIAQRCAGFDLPPERCAVAVTAARNGVDALLALDRWIVNAHKRDEHEVLIALAAHSAVGQETIDRLIAQGALRTGARADGYSPGEGAAALLLARADAPLQWPGEAVHLHRIALGKRDKSADAAGRIAGELLADLARRALETAQAAPDALACVFSDIDHRASRGVEFGDCINAALPALDPIADRRALGTACGDTGPAAGLATLALACAQAAAEPAPALALFSFDAHERGAALVRRLPVPEPSPPAT